MAFYIGKEYNTTPMANETVITPPAVTGAREVVKNCTSCNKPLKKARRYYRNGRYYCNKRCWKTAGTQAPAQPALPPKAKE